MEQIKRFRLVLPNMRQWIDQLVTDYAQQARPVSTLGFQRLSTCFPQDLLERTEMVIVSRVPFPPVSRFGLPEFASLEKKSLAGITFLNTYFLLKGHTSESLHFHEIVHIVQWAHLGPDNFLLAYAVGFAKFGYHGSPLERMAYELQGKFEKNTLPHDLISLIEERADVIWSQLVPFLGMDGGI